MIDSFYKISLFILGELPSQFAFLNAIFALVLALVFVFVVISPFIFLWKLCFRW